MTSRLGWWVACAAGALAGAAFGGCGGKPVQPVAPPARPAHAGAAAAPEPEFDPCQGSKPMPHAYGGVLRHAKCEQDMFLTMADTATQLGVECRYCHVPLMADGKEVPKKEDYPVMTEKKRIANWMSHDLMQSIKTADGSPLKCKSCHTGDDGKPVAKIFGSPRDTKKAIEWMNLVMVNRFVGLNGEKLKCRTCHEDNYTKPGFQSKIILTDRLPPHPPFAPLAPGGAAASAPPPAGSAAPAAP